MPTKQETQETLERYQRDWDEVESEIQRASSRTNWLKSLPAVSEPNNVEAMRKSLRERFHIRERELPLDLWQRVLAEPIRHSLEYTHDSATTDTHAVEIPKYLMPLPYECGKQFSENGSFIKKLFPTRANSEKPHPKSPYAKMLKNRIEISKRAQAANTQLAKALDDLRTKQNFFKNIEKSFWDAEENLELRQNLDIYPICDVEEVKILESDAVALLHIKFKDFDEHNFVSENTYKPIKSKSAIEKANSKLIKSVMLKLGKVIASANHQIKVDAVCVNASQTWHDRATGELKSGITHSLFAKTSAFESLNLTKLDIDVAFKTLKGIATPNISVPESLRPIFSLNKDDARLIDTQDVLSTQTSEDNLALMEWEEFEHLVAQVFELEFANAGSEVRVTQSSRDRGVDAIIFDPNPLTGGKYIIQAKRYTNVVGVAAVRDLYGTIMNEGANRGILITTASFGTDSYDFAKDKPISLVDGPNLIALLNKHNFDFRIDLEEARRQRLAD